MFGKIWRYKVREAKYESDWFLLEEAFERAGWDLSDFDGVRQDWGGTDSGEKWLISKVEWSYRLNYRDGVRI